MKKVTVKDGIARCSFCESCHCEYVTFVETRDAYGNVVYAAMFPLGINTSEGLCGQSNCHLNHLPEPIVTRKERKRK